MSVTFGQAKAEISLVVENGVALGDPRVLIRTNEAIRALMQDVPRGIFVGSVAAAVVTVNVVNGVNQIDLPPEMDVALVVELEQPSIALNGWYNIVNPSTFVDPDDIMDTVLVDLGFTGVNGARRYGIPELPAGVTAVKIYGLRAFAPIVSDGDVLIVQNVRAIKRMILSLEKAERYDQEEEAEKKRLEAVAMLVSELRRALIDPLRYGIRMAQWRLDLLAFAPGTLGNARALIALDVDGGQKMGRLKISRLVGRAIGWINQRVYEYELIERNRIKDSVPALAITPTDPNAAIPAGVQFEIIRQVVQALMAEDNLGDGEKGGAGIGIAKELYTAAGVMLTRVLDAQLELLRRTTYETDLRAYETTGATTTLGYFRAKLGLELPDGLKLSNAELSRRVNQGVREAIDHRNFLARSERFSNVAGPDPKPYNFALDDTAPVSYANYGILLRYVKAQLTDQPDTARAFRDEAQKLVERDLIKSVESSRNQKWQCLLMGNPPPQFGGTRARIGLEFGGDAGEGGYRMGDEYASRITQQAWSMAADHYNFLSRAEDYEKVAVALPDPVPGDSAVVPFSFEIIKMLAEYLMAQDGARDSGLKDRAFALIERNLHADVERARRVLCETQVAMGPTTFGYYVGRMGLDLPGGLTMSDAMRRRMVNKAEEALSNSGHWTHSEGEYLLEVNPAGQVTLPADVVTVLKAEWYGHRVEMRGRQWFYAGRCVRQAEGWQGWSGGCGAGLALNYAGRDDNDLACFVLAGGCVGADASGYIPKLRALCQRKWVYKMLDTDIMLVQHYPALDMMVQAGLDYTAKDYAGYNIKKNSAIKLLDDQLNVETENKTAPIQPMFTGVTMRRHGYSRR